MGRFSNTLQKPNLFQYTQYMSECLERLQNDLEFASDGALSSLINPRQLEDQLFENYRSVSLDMQYLPIPIEAQRRLVELSKATNGKDNQRCKSPTTSYRTYGNQLLTVTGLLLHYSNVVLYSLRLQAEARSPFKSNIRSKKELEAIQSTADAGRSFLNTLVDCPVSEYFLISFAEWIRLPQVVLTLCRVLFYAEDGISQSDLERIQDRVRLDLYLESLCYRMQTLTTYNPPSQPRHDFWMAMKVIIDKMREWFTQRVRQGRFAGRSEGALEVIDQSLTQYTSQQVRGHVPTNLPSGFDVIDMPADSEQFRSTANADDGVPFMPDFDFDLDQFMQMDFWGGPGSYDRTIERSY